MSGVEAEAERPRRDGGRLWRWLFGLAVLLAVGFIVLHRSEGYDLLVLAGRIRPRWLVLACAMQAATYLADAWVWARVLARSHERRPLPWLVRLSFAKFFVDQFVPTGGVTGTILVMRSLEKDGVSRGTSMAALVIRMSSYYLAYAAALAAAMWIADRAGHVPDVVFAVGLATVTAFVLLPTLLLWLLRVPHRAFPRWLERLLERRPFRKLRPELEAMRETSPTFVRDASLLSQATGLQLAIFVLDGASLWVLLLAVGVDASLWTAFAGFMLGFLAGSIGIPAGVGAFEAAAVGGLNLMGVPVAPALAGTLLFRGLSLWLPLLPGFVYARTESWR